MCPGPRFMSVFLATKNDMVRLQQLVRRDLPTPFSTFSRRKGHQHAKPTHMRFPRRFKPLWIDHLFLPTSSLCFASFAWIGQKCVSPPRCVAHFSHICRSQVCGVL